MAYEHHFEFSVLIALIALGALLYTTQMDFDATALSVGIFILYWTLASLYFLFVDHRIETARFAMVMGTISVFVFICGIAFLSRTDIVNVVIGILLSIAILLFPISYSMAPSVDLKRLAKAPQVQHAQFIPFSSCYRLDVGSPNPLYARDVPGHNTLEFSFYLKHEPATFKIIESGLVHGITRDGNRVSLMVSRKKVKENPRVVLMAIQHIAKEL